METLDQEAVLEESQQETVSLFLIWKTKQENTEQYQFLHCAEITIQRSPFPRITRSKPFMSACIKTTKGNNVQLYLEDRSAWTWNLPNHAVFMSLKTLICMSALVTLHSCEAFVSSFCLKLFSYSKFVLIANHFNLDLLCWRQPLLKLICLT